MAKAMVIIFVGAGAIALMILAVMLRGWALTVLWGWFAVPVFGLPPLGLAQALGVAMVVTMLTHQYVPSKEKDVWMPLASMILTPLFAIGIGWVVKGFM